MIDKQSVRSLIEDSKNQIKQCQMAFHEYYDDLDQRESFYSKIKYYEFMIQRLQRFL